MKCSKCGAELPTSYSYCMNCLTKVAKIEKSKTSSSDKIEIESVDSQNNFTTVNQSCNNPLLGKEYVLMTTQGFRFAFLNKITYRISVAEDRLFIKTSPEKCTTVPSIVFDDVTGITIGNKIAIMSVLYAILCIICALASTGITVLFFVLFAAVFIWSGNNKKITIYLRNGQSHKLYTKSKKDAESFKNDMRLLTKIQ